MQEEAKTKKGWEHRRGNIHIRIGEAYSFSAWVPAFHDAPPGFEKSADTHAAADKAAQRQARQREVERLAAREQAEQVGVADVSLGVVSLGCCCFRGCTASPHALVSGARLSLVLLDKLSPSVWSC